MHDSDVYATGFDEQSGKDIAAEECPECTGRFRTEGGEVTCGDCGLILTEYRLDHAAMRLSFDDDGECRKRTGAPLTPARHDRGLSSEIGFGGDANGNELTARKRRQVSRLRREHTRARWRTKAERNLGHALGEIARMAGALDLSRAVREEACSIYREAQNDDLILGRSIELMAAASLYAACRCRGDHRSIAEIAEVAQCDHDEVRLGYRVLNAELGLDAQVIRVDDRIPRLAAASAVPDRVRFLRHSMVLNSISILIKIE